jgi:hypothetical protein
MNKMNLLVMTLVLGTAFGVSAQAAEYKCHGVKGTKGEMTLTLGKKFATASVSGSYQTDENDPSKKDAVDCDSTGLKRRDVKKFSYFDFKKSPKCPADYIRLATDFATENEGLMALVDRSGGDRHDWSGFAYTYYYCGDK